MLLVVLLVIIAVGWMLVICNQPSKVTSSKKRQKTSSSRGSKECQLKPFCESSNEKLLRGRVGSSTAERLVNHVLKKNPGRSRDWCIDKALQDLQRDCRG
jgi:hypothetical protein